MRIRLNFFLVALAQKLILINLLAVFISGSLVFAQGPEYFVLIVTKGNSLNVREEPLASSAVVATLPNDSKVPFIEPAVKRYRFDHIRRKVVQIQKDEEEIAIFLPLERFRKASKSQVWSDSKRRAG